MNLFRKIQDRLLNPKNLLARSQAPAGRSTEYQTLEPRCLMAGDFVWANQFAGDAAESGQAITTDSFGSVYTFGNFSGTVDFDPSQTQTLDEAVVGQTLSARCSVNALNPQSTEVALTRLAVTVAVDH